MKNPLEVTSSGSASDSKGISDLNYKCTKNLNYVLRWRPLCEMPPKNEHKNWNTEF